MENEELKEFFEAVEFLRDFSELAIKTLSRLQQPSGDIPGASAVLTPPEYERLTAYVEEWSQGF